MVLHEKASNKKDHESYTELIKLKSELLDSQPFFLLQILSNGLAPAQAGIVILVLILFTLIIEEISLILTKIINICTKLCYAALVNKFKFLTIPLDSDINFQE